MKIRAAAIFATILTLTDLKDLHSLKEIVAFWLVFYLIFKIGWKLIKYTAKCPLPRRSRFSFLDPSAITQHIMDSFDIPTNYHSNVSQRQAADRRVWERTKAQNNARYQEYQARKANAYNPNSYDAYQKRNRAQNARNEANKRR